MAFPLTEEQRNIVEDRGGELLVSAAAGSGKTRVLVERLLDRVTGEGLDIDRFLVITYTKAAAGELRTRIAQELASRLAAEGVDSQDYAREMDIQAANILDPSGIGGDFEAEWLLNLLRRLDEANADLIINRFAEIYSDLFSH